MWFLKRSLMWCYLKNVINVVFPKNVINVENPLRIRILLGHFESPWHLKVINVVSKEVIPKCTLVSSK